MDNPTTRVQRALADLSAGRPVVVTALTPDEDAHLVIAAEKADVQSTAFLVRHGSGLLCAALPATECDRLGLSEMAGADRIRRGVDYVVSIDSLGSGTGISAADRAATLRCLNDPSTTADSFTRPGHVLPARTAARGVLDRPSIAEASVDLVTIAGTGRVGAFTALVSVDVPTAICRSAEADRFGSEHGIAVVSIRDIVIYRRMNELHLSTEYDVVRDTELGTVHCRGFRSDLTGIQYSAYTVPSEPTTSPTVLLERDLDPTPHLTRTESVREALAMVTGTGGGTVIVVTDTMESASEVDVDADLVEVVRECGHRCVDPVHFPDSTRTMMWHFGLRIETGGASVLAGPPVHSKPTRIVGTVVHGDQRGRELGFRTANVELEESSIVADGVWAGRCTLGDGSIVPAAISVGRRPTFYGRSGVRLLEAHLLDFTGDLYGSSLTIELEHWMRGQVAFASKEELIAALSADVVRTRRVLASASPERMSA